MTEYEKARRRAWDNTKVTCPYCGKPHCLKDFEDGVPGESSGCEYLTKGWKPKVVNGD